jgi:hypothetical protein
MKCRQKTAPFGAQHSIWIRLERERCLVWTFDFLFGLEEFFTPGFACALGALVNRVPNRETVIAGSLGAAAGELLASLAGLEELAFERPVLVPQFVFTNDAHALLVTTQLSPLSFASGAVLGRVVPTIRLKTTVLRLRFPTIIATRGTLPQ